ncbi:MAG: 50S ribosomal protein L29 [Armatimonadota bacterium]|nr:50S ribosomal protein L29 [Armatimonadota bacterium]
MKRAQYREQLRQSTDAELRRMLQEERKNLFLTKRDAAMKQLENPMRIREVRKNIARILTILKERELKAEKGR